jgi:hypothetical protein
MDGSQFDTLLRSLTTARSRRSALLGMLGLLGLTEAEAKHHKKKKKKKGGSPPASPPPSPPLPPAPQCPTSCPSCQECVNGQSCTPKGNGSSCEGNPCKACQSGACVDLAGNTVCNSTGRCLNGTCNQPLNCVPFSSACNPTGAPCCAGTCNGVGNTCPTQGGAGAGCVHGYECLSNSCVGYRCQ